MFHKKLDKPVWLLVG